MAEAQERQQSDKGYGGPAKGSLTRAQIVDRIFQVSQNDTKEAAKLAIEEAKKLGTDDAYKDAVSLLNDAAVGVPGTKTIWTERRLREYVDLGRQHLGH